MSNLANRVKSARQAKNLTQKQLAELTGLTQQTICNSEKANFFPRDLTKLAEALDVTVNWLRFGDVQKIETSAKTKKILSKIPIVTFDSVQKCVSINKLLKTIYGGKMIERVLNIEDYLSKEEQERGSFFGLKINKLTDDMISSEASMYSLYKDDIAIFMQNANSKLESGQVVCAIYKGYLIIRKYVDNMHNKVLKALNSQYDPIEINEHVEIVAPLFKIDRECLLHPS